MWLQESSVQLRNISMAATNPDYDTTKGGCLDQLQIVIDIPAAVLAAWMSSMGNVA
jgi:hypothetical protein